MPPDRKLVKIADAYYAFTRDQQEYYNIINYFLSSPRIFFNEDQKNHVDMAGSRILQVIQEIVLHGIDTGYFNKTDPPKIFHHVLGGPCDVSRQADCEKAVAAVLERFGRIDILFNNAGITHRSLFAQTRTLAGDGTVADHPQTTIGTQQTPEFVAKKILQGIKKKKPMLVFPFLAAWDTRYPASHPHYMST